MIEKFFPEAGGNERSTQQIVRRLVRRGHRVALLTNQADPATDVPQGAHVISAEGWSTAHAAGLARFIRWAERRLERGGYDVSLSMTTAVPAHVMQPRGGTVRETLERSAASRPTTRGRSLARWSQRLSPKRQALLAAERRSLGHPSVRRIVAISRYVADQLADHYALGSERIELIPNAAEVERFDPERRGRIRREVRGRAAIDEEDVVFLFAAMNPRLKGLESLLKAMDRLLRNHPRAKLLIAGSHDTSWRRRAEAADRRDAVRWIGPARKMNALYAAADATVLPTWYDPSSKVVLESLLHGVPAISTLYNGASQWILNPSNPAAAPPPPRDAGTGRIRSGGQPAGRVIRSPADIEALAAAMADLCDNEERSRCAAATAGPREWITMDRHTDQLERVLMDASRPSINRRPDREPKPFI